MVAARKAIFLLTFVVFLSACLAVTAKPQTASASQSVAAIENYSFEEKNQDGSYGFYLPSKWKINASSVYLTYPDSGAYDGKIYLDLANNSSAYVLSSKSKVSVSGGGDYRFGFKFRVTDIAAASCRISVIPYSENGTACDEATGNDFTAPVADSWTDAYVDFKADADTSSVIIKITVSVTKGSCGIDCVYGYEKAVFTGAGASIRLSADSPGLRFTGRVDKIFYDGLLDGYSSVSAGILIAPTEYLNKTGEFTVKSFKDSSLKYLDIQASVWNNSASAAEDGYYGFSCAMVDIMASNVTRSFSARAYVKYTESGAEKYIYADYCENEHARSVYAVANRAKEYLDSYDEEQQKIITAYANGTVPDSDEVD